MLRVASVGRRRSSRCAADDQGSGSVLAIGLLAVVLVLAAALGVLGRAQSARSAAQAAADLAAIAAASSIALPPGVVLAPGAADRGSPCDLAGQVIERNGAVVVRCVLLPDGVVQVIASRSAGFGTATAIARAGPASARGAGR